MSRENEKVLAELRKFLELHNEELNDEKDFDRLAEQFLSQHNGSLDGGSMERSKRPMTIWSSPSRPHQRKSA